MSKPIVAVVGRPNVGKSTLFNRLAGERISIVQDTPGVTRDRIYADVEWLNHKFTLIDTGGMEIGSEEIIQKQILQQAEIAIETADVILFVTDVKAGVTDDDRQVANKLRRTQKPVVLAVNKVDSVKRDTMDIYEFYELAIGDPMPISAGQALGLGDMLDQVVAHFPEDSDAQEEDDAIKVAIIGKPNVGKSSLINKILGEDRLIVSNIPGTTRDTVEEYINIDGIPVKIVDTAGIRETGDVVEKMGVEKSKAYAEQADLILMMLDASRPLEAEDREILSFIDGKHSIVMLNKSDLEQKLSLEELEQFVPKEQILFVSVKENTGFDALIDAIKTLFFSGQTATADDALLGNTRHKNALYQAKEAMERCLVTIGTRMPEDFISMDLQDASRALGEITGDVADEEIIDRIFTKFCLGK